MASVEDQAWVTLATNDSYALGALVLGQSLRRVSTSRKLVVLITPTVTESMRAILGQLFDLVQIVNVLDSNDTANLALLTRPDLGITFTKLHCWRLVQYTKCVFLDADTLIIQNCDELFEREELSAAPDVGWPDCFNSGVFVFRPSDETYQHLLQHAVTIGSFDGGDQGLLNSYFCDWATKDIARHLPFVYNMTSSASYSYLPAYVTFGKDVKIVHFIGPVKPWMHRFNATTGRVEPTPGAFHALEHLQYWWNVFVQDVKPHLQPDLAGLAGQLAALITLGQEISPEQKALEDRARQFSWEQGQADYLGADAFANIQKKLDEALVAETGSLEPPSVQETAAPVAPAPTEAVPPSAPEIPIAPVLLPDVSTLSLAISQEIMSQSLSSVPLEASQVTTTPVSVVTTSEPVVQIAASTTEAQPSESLPVLPSHPAESPTEAPQVELVKSPQCEAPASQPLAESQPEKPTSPVTVSTVTTVAILPTPLDAGPIPPEPISPPPALPPPSKPAPRTPPAAAAAGGQSPLASLPAASGSSPSATAPQAKPSKSSGTPPQTPPAGAGAPPKPKGSKKQKSP